MKRLFFALDISADQKQLIAAWRDSQLHFPFKAVSMQNFHITVVFLGVVTEQQQQALLINKANSVVKQIFPVDNRLLLTTCGLFKKPQVLYLNLHDSPTWLTILANTLSTAASDIGLFQENRLYHPHLSLYRKATSLTTNKSINLTLPCQSFSLYHSMSTASGVVYQPLITWPLN